MATLRARQRREAPYKRDARVYVLVEEARIRCEALRGRAPQDPARAELQRVHRDLGLSGLYVSTTIPSSVRRALLARVHERCEHLKSSPRGLARTVRQATRELARTVSKHGAAEHRELAHLHLLRAMEFLIAAPSPRPSGAHSFRQRHLA
jgi:hypothetical protein